MFCTLSGKVPTSPVVNRKTGRLYERRLIEKALQQTAGKCPDTDEPIEPDDLIPLLPGKPGTKPPDVSAADLAGVPAVLSHLQAQWDAADLERHQLRRSLRETRQELASALYRLDAAIRAIARLRADAPDVPAVAAQNGANAAAAKDKDDAPPAPQPPATADDAEPANGKQADEPPRAPDPPRAEEPRAEPVSVDVKDEEMVTGEQPAAEAATAPAAAAASPKTEAPDKPVAADAKTERSVAAQSSEEAGAGAAPVEPTCWPAELVAKARELEAKLFAKRKARIVPDAWTPADDVARFSVAATATATDGRARGAVADLVTVCGDDGRETAFVAWRGGRVGALRTKPMMDCGGLDGAHAGGATAVWADRSAPTRALTGGADGVVRVWDCGTDWTELTRFDGPDTDSGGRDGGGAAVVGLQRHPVGSVALVGRVDAWEWRDIEHGTLVGRGASGDGVGYARASVHPDGRLFAMGRDDGVVELVDSSGMKVVERLRGGDGDGGDVRGVAMSEKGYQMAVAHADAVRLWDLRKHKVVGEVRLDGRGRGVALDGMGEYGVAVAHGSAALFLAKKKTRVMARIPLDGAGGGGGGGGGTRLGVAWSDAARAVLVGCDNGDVLKLAAS